MVTEQSPHDPTARVELITAWQPAGSSTVLWAVDLSTRQPLRLMKQGSKLLLPAYEGMHLGIGLYNGSDGWRAYPTYVEGSCLYVGGPAQPNDCQPSHMWELQPCGRLTMEALMNPNAQLGRPLTMTISGDGFAIGEASFNTTEYRGQIRVYERTGHTPERLTPRGGSKGVTTMGGGPEESFGGGLYRSAPAAHGSSDHDTYSAPVTRGAPVSRGVPQARPLGIGAGAEEPRTHVYTGQNYHADARLLAALQVAPREDLAVLLRAANLPASWNWTPDSPDWYARRPQATAPHIPTAPSQPHRPFGTNQGWPV